MLSFSSDVKSEICAIGIERDCCLRSMLNAAFAYFKIINNNRIKMYTENVSAARFLNTSVKRALDVECAVSFKKNRYSNGFTLEITNAEDILKIGTALKLLDQKTGLILGRINHDFSVRECCKKSAVKGAFLTAGSITDPKKRYHFEIASHRAKVTNDMCTLLEAFDIPVKIVKRGANSVLYVKEKELIADMLNLMGVKRMFFLWHETVMEKEIKNTINRKQNFEQANLDKTIGAAVAQTAAIRKLISNNKLEALPEALRNAATLRIDNPDSSLSDLILMSKENITKSGLNRRLNRLVALAKNIGDDNEGI